MNKKKWIAQFCMFLIITLPISLAQTFEETGESLIIEAKKYEPETLRSDYMEQLNIPVRVILGAIRGAPISVPEIKRVHVELIKRKEAQKENASVKGTSEEIIKDYIRGTPKFYKAPYPSLDNLGFVQITLKKIPEEKKVPEKINLDFKATIEYEAELAAFTIGGENTVTLQPGTKEMVEEDSKKHSILGGMYYLRVISIKGKKATIEILDQDFKKVTSKTLEEGEISTSIRLHKEEEIEPKSIRLKLEEIGGSGTITLEFEGEEDKTFDKKENIGEGWELEYQSFDTRTEKGYIILRNKEEFKSSIIILATEDDYDSIEDIQNLIDNCGTKKCEYLYEGSGIEKIKTFKTKNKDELQEALRSLESLGLKMLKSIEPKKTQRYVIFAGDPEKYYQEAKIGTCKKRGELTCEITRITTEKVTIKGIKECDEYEDSNTITLEIGESDNICGDFLEVERITTDQEATITALPGTGKGTTTTYFSVHIPVEKRAIQYTPEELREKINKTQALIKKLDNTINKLQKLVEGWTKVCLATAAVFTVMSFFQGVSGKAKEKVEEREEAEEAEKIQKITLKFPHDVDELTLKRDVREQKEKTLSKKNEYQYTPQNGVIYEGNDAIATSDFRFLDKKNKAYYKIRDDGQFIEADKYHGDFRSGDGSGKEDIIISSDLNTIVVPLKRCGQLTEKEYKNACEVYRKNLGTALYLVYNKETDYIQGWWGGEDGKLYQYDKSGKDDGDKPLDGLFIDGRLPEGKRLKTEMIKIRDSYQRKERSIKFKGETYSLGKTHLSAKKDGVECVEVMGEGQCKILFNACDPVMCPASRCDFSGRYRIDNVIQSGFFGSLLLCLPNIKTGVIMPVCLSGILAALKNLRSILQGYVNCLQAALQDDKSVGICDRIRSIYICQILWKEAMTMLGLARGNLFDAAISRGGGEYLTGVKGGVANAKKTVDFFTKDYATSVFAAYRGRSSKEIGAAICEKAVYGKGPILGEIVEDITKAQNPPQFTAYLEEQPLYSETAQESAYKLYYHIYAGSQTVNYKVYIKKDTKTYTCSECSGTIEPENFVDKSTLFMYEPYYQEVCVSINGKHYCNFGKVVSSSFGVNRANNYVLEYELSKKIETEAQCRADPRGYIPEAQVEKTCSQLNPGIGKGRDIEEQWKKVGSCGKNEQGVFLGNCWMKLGDIERTNPELYRDTVSNICEENDGEVCNVNQECDGREERTSVRNYQGVTCCYGKCVDDEKYEKIGVELLDEEFVKSDDVYQITYEKGKEICENKKIGTTDPFDKPPVEWSKKEEPREGKEYNQYHYFKGNMYLLCENCDKASIEFNQLEEEYFKKACGENTPVEGGGGIMLERCKKTCGGEKLGELKKPGEKKEEKEKPPAEGGVNLLSLELYKPDGTLFKETSADDMGKEAGEYKTDLEEGGLYKIELHFSKSLDEDGCTIKVGGSQVETEPPKTTCKTKEALHFLGDKINVEFDVKSKDEELKGMIVFTNKEESAGKNKFLLCTASLDTIEERMCVSTEGKRCSDYCVNQIRYKLSEKYDNFGDCITERDKAQSAADESKRTPC